MVLFYRTCRFATKGLILVARMHEMVASYDALLWSNAGPKTFRLKGFSPGLYVIYLPLLQAS